MEKGETALFQTCQNMMMVPEKKALKTTSKRFPLKKTHKKKKRKKSAGCKRTQKGGGGNGGGIIRQFSQKARLPDLHLFMLSWAILLQTGIVYRESG